MVYPQLTDRALSGYRTLALIWQRKYMHRQFCTFLRRKYGPDWLPRLLTVRRQAKAIAVAAMAMGGSEETPPTRKRVQQGGGVDTSGSVSDGFLPPRTELLLHLDGDSGCQVLNRYFGGQWWDWKAGSALAFWRWNGEEQIEDARDGMQVYIKDTLPKNKIAQRVPKPDDLRLMFAKLDKVLERGYISPGFVASLTSYFTVPKGEHDIRLVYDGTDSGLSDALWLPSFWLPNSSLAVRLLLFYSFLFDSDIGECFLNFPNDPKIRPYCGSI
jgi:hypothetical protein